MRVRFLRQAWDLYKAGCAREKLSERNEESCEHLKKALAVKAMRRCFKGIQAFNLKNMRAKKYWKILLGKMDHWMKKRAFGMWMDGGNSMKMEFITDHQNALTEEMIIKSKELGDLTKKLADSSGNNAGLTKDLIRTGQRSLSNAFARAYYKRTARAFELWKIFA
jgi:hypothetical protein